MSSHARSTRRKSNTAVEQIETDWKHAAVRPAPHVELPEWLLEETDKVAHRDYSTGFYYPEHKVTQNTDRSAYFRSWLVVGEVLSWSADEDGAPVPAINNPAHVFSMPCPHQVPINAAIRSRTKKPTLKAE